MQFTRRTALSLALGLWTEAESQTHAHEAPEKAPTPPRMKFLTPPEVATIARFAAIMIPSSNRSGGAAAAGVQTYFDYVLASGAPSLQRTWRRGLAEWSKSKDPSTTLAQLAPHEFDPQSQADQFFVLFKSALTAAFYTSEEGIRKELGYKGMDSIREFKGYAGEPFVIPATYKPLLKART